MTFFDTAVHGAFIVEPERIADDRGFFARTWAEDELRRRGLETGLSQCSVSQNVRKGTLRGLHYQVTPHEETKLVSCTRGAVYDVAVDLRPGSKTYGCWAAAELSADNGRALYIPRGCAHGYQTLTPDAVVFYMICGQYAPGHARGVRWNDPAFAIAWPGDDRAMNDRDRNYPDHVR